MPNMFEEFAPGQSLPDAGNMFAEFSQPQTDSVEQPAQQPEGSAIRRGSFLPISVDKDGNMFFDPSTGVIGAIADAVTLPGDVFSGEVDPNSDEAVRRATDLALTASPATAAARTARVATASAPKPKLRTVEEIKQAASAAYKRADDAGVVLTEAGFARAADRMLTALKKEPFSPRIHQGVQRAINEIGDRVGKAQTLGEVDLLRRVVASAGKSQNADERRLVGLMVDELDSFMSNLKGRDVLAGDADAGAKALIDARKLWATQSKARVIEKVFDDAGLDAGNFSGSGFENALRRGFISLAKNERRLRGFSKKEVQAIKRVAKGTQFNRLAQFFGRFAPKGPVTFGLSVGAGAVNPLFAALPVAGAIGRLAATKSRVKAVNRLRREIQQIEPPQRARVALERAGRLVTKSAQRPVTQAETVGALTAPGS